MRDGHRRRFGIQVDGRHVEREMFAHLGDEQAGETLDTHARQRRELECHPVAQLARRQDDRGVADRHGHARGGAIEGGLNRQDQRRRVLEERVLRALERGGHPVAGQRDVDAHAAFLELLGRRARGVEQEGALRAEQIGHAHRAQLGAVEVVRRKRDGDAQHGAPDAVLAENRPERLGPPQQSQLRFLQRNAVPAKLQEALHLADAGGREHRQVGAAIAIEEVEDVVTRRVGPGAERRPRHRRQRWKRRLQAAIAAFLRQRAEVGQQALAHELVGELRVLAVEADDDESGDGGLGAGRQGEQAPRRAEWPRQQREGDDEERRDQHERRGHQREAGSGADVC